MVCACLCVYALCGPGLSHLPAASAALDALERWLRTDSATTLLPLLDDALPLLGQLMVKSMFLILSCMCECV